MELYKKVIRPIFFKFDPEKIHVLVLWSLRIVSQIKPLCWLIKKYLFIASPKLEVSLGKFTVPNLIGLAAGFDKNIEAPLAYKMLGFGFVEFGSITYEPQAGNLKPRLWRLPKDESLIVNYGLCNIGVKAALEKLKKISIKARPFGVSIAPSVGLKMEEMADDCLRAFVILHPYVDFLTLNISCPNVANSDNFAQISFIAELLRRTRDYMDSNNIVKDIYLKIGPDMKSNNLDSVVDLCLQCGVAAIIATNLLKNRANLSHSNSLLEELNHLGGISGRLLRDKSNETISRVKQRAGDKLKVIGVGGIFTARDVYDKLRCGADAVQLITGWIYGGPLLIRQLNKNLLKLMAKGDERVSP